MKLYLAAPYAARDFVRGQAGYFWLPRGYQITCKWIEGTREISPATLGTSPDSSDEEVKAHALADLDQVREADVLVHYSAEYLERMGFGPVNDRLHTGGRHVETGYALALGIAVVVIGEPENIFLRSMAYQASDVEHAHSLLMGP